MMSDSLLKIIYILQEERKDQTSGCKELKNLMYEKVKKKKSRLRKRRVLNLAKDSNG